MSSPVINNGSWIEFGYPYHINDYFFPIPGISDPAVDIVKFGKEDGPFDL